MKEYIGPRISNSPFEYALCFKFLIEQNNRSVILELENEEFADRFYEINKGYINEDKPIN